MNVDQDRSGLADLTARRTSGNHPLSHASQRIGDYRDGRSHLKARDLVGLLLSHGARAWRASQPQADIRLRVRTPAGVPAIRMRLR